MRRPRVPAARGRRWIRSSSCWSIPRVGTCPVSLQLTDTPPREPVRVHLDLYTDAQQRHVDAAGRSRRHPVTDWPYPDDADFVVLRDPDGNEFCVIDHVDP